jgi:hypothetical protein
MREFSYQCLDCNGSTLSFDKFRDEYFCVRCPFTISKHKADKLSQTDNPEYKIGFSTVYDYNGTRLLLDISKIKDPLLRKKLNRRQKRDKLSEIGSLEKSAVRASEKAARKALKKLKDSGAINTSPPSAASPSVSAGKRVPPDISKLSEKEMQLAIKEILAKRKLENKHQKKSS